MSVLIKGMDMPENCFACPCCNPYPGTCLYCGALNGLPGIISPDSGRLDDCPLAEIPTPRGRLIDADELIERIERFRDIHNYYPADIDATMRWFINQICGAKTIIEAENSSAIDDDVKKYCDYLKSETYDFCNRIENGEVSEE